MADVFISYSSVNKDAANAICHVLEENGVRCWIAPRDILQGFDYGDVIEKQYVAVSCLCWFIQRLQLFRHG